MDDRPQRPRHDGFLRAGDARRLRESLGQGPTARLPRSGRSQRDQPPRDQPPRDQPRRDQPRRDQPPRASEPYGPWPYEPRTPRSPATGRPRPDLDRERLLRLGKIAIATVSALVLVFTGYAWATYQQITDKITTTPIGLDPAPDGATDVLLVGNDSRTDAQGNPLSKEVLAQLRAGGNEGELTDTLILVRIPNDGRSAVGISIPRDTFVDIPGGYGKHKINSAWGRARTAKAERLRATGVTDAAQIDRESTIEGRKTLVKTIEGLTGAGIDHYAEVNLLGFYEITQAIGGVDVCLNHATRDPDSGANFKAGRQTISGADALAFVRQRKNLPRGDLDRIVRQQVFMSAVAQKVLSAGTLTNRGKLNALIGGVQRSLVLDDRLDPLAFAQELRGIATGAIQFVTIPVLDIAAKTADGDSVTVDRNAVRQFVKGLASGPPQQASSSSAGAAGAADGVDKAAITVEVRNSSGVAGLAGRVLDELANRGFGRGDAANATARATSVVHFAAGELASADAVAQALGGLPTEQDAALPAGHVRVFLGQDYDGPGVQRMAAGPLVALDGRSVQAQPTSAPPVTAGDVRCVD